MKKSSVFKIGGYKDRNYYKPIEIKATIESFHKGEFVYEGGPLDGI
mgnify:CR=1 FL=1